MKPQQLFEPLSGTPGRRPSRREYVLGGLLCTTLTGGAWAVDIGLGGVITFGVLAIGCFVLAVRTPAFSQSRGQGVPPN